MSSFFRCAGDVVFDKSPSTPGQVCKVQLRDHSETSSFLQYLSPLTPEKPYFFIQVLNLGMFLNQNSKIIKNTGSNYAFFIVFISGLSSHFSFPEMGTEFVML